MGKKLWSLKPLKVLLNKRGGETVWVLLPFFKGALASFAAARSLDIFPFLAEFIDFFPLLSLN